MEFAWFMALFMNPLLLIVGVLLGATWVVCGGSWVYRVLRRRSLHREFKAKKPRHMSAVLEPRWDEYDPYEPHVDTKCVCHKEKVKEGALVLLWPEAGSLGLIHISVYCQSVRESV